MNLNLLDSALLYASYHWPVLPLHTWDGQRCTCGRDDCTSPAKHPRTKNGLKDATIDMRIIKSWWGRWPDANIGLRTGIEFDVLDVDGDAGFDAIDQMENQYGGAPLGPSSHTGGGGLHRLYQPTGIGNRAGIVDHVDWRGQNGYIVAPPSRHASGGSYEWAAHEHPDDIALQPVSGWLHNLLFPPQKPRPKTTIPRTSSDNAYGKKAFDSEIAELIRAGEGTRNHTLNACAFNLYQLVAGGELDEHEVTDALTAAGRGIGLNEREIAGTLNSARTSGLTSPRTAPVLTVVAGNNALKPTLNTRTDPGDPEEPTGWERLDLAAILNGDIPTDLPDLYPRSDDQPLLYQGKVHSFNGEPESGKSWCALAAAVWALTRGRTVTYLDFEDNPASIVGRLIALGATPDDVLHRFHYHRIDQPYNLDASLVLDQALDVAAPTLAVLDGITEAMNLCGLDPYGNTDVAKFWAIIPRRLARTGAAVVLIDHVTKSRDERGKWAIGAQHKMAAIDGAAFGFETSQPFGRNRHGVARVTIRKDRPGHLRQHANGDNIGEFHLASTEGHVDAWIAPPPEPASDGKWRPTALMERVSRHIELHPRCSRTEVETEVSGKSEWIRRAITVLLDEAHLDEVVKGNRRHELTSVKPFRDTSNTPQNPEDEDT